MAKNKIGRCRIHPTYPIHTTKNLTLLKSFTLRAVMAENLRRPIAHADDRPTPRIWHAIIASARGVVWLKKIDEGTSMRPRSDGACVATRLAFRSDGRSSGQCRPIPTRPSSIGLFSTGFRSSHMHKRQSELHKKRAASINQTHPQSIKTAISINSLVSLQS